MTKQTDMSQLRPRRAEAPRRAEKKRPPTNHEVEKGLRQSLESTDEGLRKFLEALRGSGMADAVQGYRAMQMVLVQQRLWAEEHHRDQLMPLFQSIARTAEDLHRIFASFADIMKPLKELDKLSASTAAPPEDGPPSLT